MSEETFESWAVVELFGHQRMAGLVTEQTVGGCAFVRVDVPTDDGAGVLYTRLLGQGAIYAINIVSEQVAREAAKRLQTRPVYGYEIPRLAGPREPEYTDQDDVPY